MNYLLDSNIFFIDPKCLERFEDSDKVYLCETVLEELDKHKTDKGKNGFNIRKSIKSIEENEDINMVMGYDEIGLDMSINDNKILGTAKKHNLILITNDVSMRVKAKMVGVSTEKYNKVTKTGIGNIRKGRHIIDSECLLSKFYEDGKIPISDDMYNNDFIIFKQNDKVVDFGIVKEGFIYRKNLTKQRPKEIKYKNIEQQLLATHIYENDLELITICGTMGVGKNFMSIAIALDLIDKGKYDKLFICKSPIPLDKDFQLGFRKGDWLSEKIMPTMSSFTSNLDNLKQDRANKKVSGRDILMGLIDFGIVEIVDLEYIQGRTLPANSIIIFDEFQLMCSDTGRGCLSRCGTNSLILGLGDLGQLPKHKHLVEDSALYHTIDVFSGYKKSAHIVLEEVVRSGFVAELDRRW